MKKTKPFLVAASAVLLIMASGCSKDKTSEESSVSSKGDAKGTAPAASVAKQADKALVRFVNGTTSAKDLAFGDGAPFVDVGARDITAYKEVPAERHEFKLLAHKDQSVLTSDSEGLTAGKHYTVLAYADKAGKAVLHNETDDLTVPAAGQAKVRLINLAPGAQNLDLYAGNKKDAVISGVGADHISDFKEIDPSQAELNVRHGMSKKNSAPVKDVDLKAGKLYSIVVFQDKNGALKTKTVEDQFNAAPEGTTSK